MDLGGSILWLVVNDGLFGYWSMLMVELERRRRRLLEEEAC